METQVTVGTLMSSPVVTTTERASLEAARAAMDSRHIHHLPVLSADGQLVGLISDRDLSRALEVVRAATGRRHLMRVEEVMQRKVLSIAVDRPAPEAARLLTEQGIGALPVLDGNRLVGIITASDFVAIAAEWLPVHKVVGDVTIEPHVRATIASALANNAASAID